MKLPFDTDCTFIADTVWAMLTDSEQAKRIFQVEAGNELVDMGGGSGGKHTRLVFHKSQSNMGTVFVSDRKDTLLARSTLTPPRGKKPLTGCGMVPGIVVAASTTSMTDTVVPDVPVDAARGQAEEIERVNSVVIQGGVTWHDEDGTRCTFVVSYPPEFKMGHQGTYDAALDRNGNMTEWFASLLHLIAHEFVNTVQARVDAAAVGME